MKPDKDHRPCKRIRSKGMYIVVEPDPLVPSPHDGFCWCSRTQNALGPDGNPVLQEDCCSGRDCYEEN